MEKLRLNNMADLNFPGTPINEQIDKLDFPGTPLGELEKPVPSMKEKIFNTIETVFDRDDKTEEALGSTSVETTLRPKARPVVEAVEPEPPASFEGVSKRLVSDLMSDFGLTQVQAVALAGNLAYESANFQTMQEILDKKRQGRGDRGGLGYAQWTDTSKKNNRRTQFEEFAKQNNLSTSSYEANYGYLKKELSERIPGSLENMGKNMITRLKNTNDLESAVKVVMAGYLRPKAYVKRKQNPSAYNTLVNKRTNRAKQVQGLL